jgi:hypothetical protein
MSKRDRRLKLDYVRVKRRAGRIEYRCEEDSEGLIRFGIIRLPRSISAGEELALVRRLRQKRLEDVDQILSELLNIEIRQDVDLGDVTP